MLGYPVVFYNTGVWSHINGDLVKIKVVTIATVTG